MKTNRLKLNIFKLPIIILFLSIIISIPIIAEEKPGTVLLGDFIVTLVNLEREGDTANLEFSITKVVDSNSGCQSLVVYLIDDHENKYNGSLSVDLENAPDVVLNALPKGFTYVDKVDISMPKAAPIVKIGLEDREVPFKDVKLGQPQFITDFGDLAITKGQSVPLGKWLSFTMEQAIPKVPSWELPITIENKEYNPLSAGVRLGVQNRDGTISWGGSLTVDVAALSKTSVSVFLPFQETPPQPRILMLEYIDRKAGEHIFKVFPMPPGKLLPFAVAGKIYEKWKGENFKLGLPIGDEQSASVFGAQGSSASGRFQSFERGRIYVITSGAQAGQVLTISGAAYEASGLVHNLTKDTYYDTIQAALDDAGNDDTIEVAEGTYKESIVFPPAKKLILRSTTGASTTTIQGNVGSPTVTFTNGSLAGTTLEGFTVTHASGNRGSGIFNRGNLIIKNCIISGNTAEFTGGIYNKGSLTITGSTISGNSASFGGGGITSQHGSITIIESTISGNTTSSSGGGIDGWRGSITITGSTISGNSASSGGGGIAGGDGSITIIESTISGNSSKCGGGITYFEGSITITGSTISGNSASSSGGGIHFSYQTSGILPIGGSNDAEKNTICGNYKDGDSPSLDQQIRDGSGSLYDTYKDTNDISAYCD
jgi:hypothetical protein